jgi:hypothetical protein
LDVGIGVEHANKDASNPAFNQPLSTGNLGMGSCCAGSRVV